MIPIAILGPIVFWILPFVVVSDPDPTTSNCFEMHKQARALRSLEDPVALPKGVIDRAKEAIASRVGGEYADAYYRYAPEYSTLAEPDYFCELKPEKCHPGMRQDYFQLMFIFHIPEKPFINQLVGLLFDTNGHLISNLDEMSIPPCIENPDACTFPVDEVQAIEIAADNGLAEGMEGRIANFLWNYKHKKYIWHVQNLLERRQYVESGDWVSIDANTGAVVHSGKWDCIEDVIGVH